jgi:hypothetical protein
MQRAAAKAIIVWVAIFAFAPGLASGHTGAPFVSFGHGKRTIAIFTKSECIHGVRCKSRVRHCNRWARNQISCQSEVLFWAKNDALTYCHWQSLAWRIRRSKPLEVWSEPKPACQPMQNGPHWPVRRPSTSPSDSEEQRRGAEPVEPTDALGTEGEKPRQVVKIDWIKIRDLGRG